MREIHQRIPVLIKAGEVGAYCTVVEAKGSTPQKPGFQAVDFAGFTQCRHARGRVCGSRSATASNRVNAGGYSTSA